MNEEKIRRYAQLMRELNLRRLSVSEKGTEISLETMGGGGLEPAAQYTERAEEKAGAAAGPVSVLSPMVGVYYAAPAENADPFVSVGDKVQKGDVVCIIEAMKLMNEIRAEADGVVEKICVTNGQVVEYGTEIMRIRRERIIE